MNLFEDGTDEVSRPRRQGHGKRIEGTSVSESGDSSVKGDDKIHINKAFAKSFEQKERLKDLERAKYLSDDDDDYSDSDEESEDDEAELLSNTVDIKILQTINSIRKKDPRIYDASTKWFDETADSSGTDDEEHTADYRHQRKTYKDVVREQLLTENSEDRESEENTNSAVTRSKKSLIYDSEQQNLRTAFLQSFEDPEVEEADSQEGRIFQVKPKSKKQIEDEERQLKAALEEMKKTSTETEADKFLNEFVSNRKWVSDQKTSGFDNYDSSDYEKEESELDREDLFESQYNFRFEELEQNSKSLNHGLQGVQVQGHSRNVEGTVRRVDDKRKLKRQEREERKAHEKRQKEEELKHLKNLKKEEVRIYSQLPCVNLNYFRISYGNACTPLAKWPD
jgi:protein KRI1